MYPDFIRPAAEAIARGEYDRRIVIGGSGNGEAIVANRIKGFRCAVFWNIELAILSRQRNDANMLSNGQRLMKPKTALAIVNQWLETNFEGGRHIERIRKIDLGMQRWPYQRCSEHAPMNRATTNQVELQIQLIQFVDEAVEFVFGLLLFVARPDPRPGRRDVTLGNVRAQIFISL